jgi:transglutaminase-like putative cysteine protease
MYLNGGTATATANPNELKGYLGIVPSGAAGIKATLHIMRAMVRAGKKNLQLRDFAAQLTRHIPQKDFSNEARALFEYVRDRVRYVRDIHGVETVQTPDKTLQLGYGDCDDKSVLLATLLETLGHPTRFIAIGTRVAGMYEHVYLETLIGRKWVAMDATEPHAMGWFPPKTVGPPLVVHN